MEIANSIVEQNNKDLDKVANKGDLRALKDDIVLLKNDLEKTKLELGNKIVESKYDLLKWIITAQVAIAGFLLAVIKFT